MISNYADLQQAMEDHLDRDDLSSNIQNFISLAEARHKREIRIREMLTRLEVTIFEGDRYIDLPTDFLDHKYLRIRMPVGSCRRFLPDFQQLNTHELTLQSVDDKRVPLAYAVHEQIELDSEADRDYDAEHFYYIELTALSDANPTNALLTRAPDVYLYAALLASAPFLLNDERIQVWGSLYTEAKSTLNISQQESRRGSPLVSRVQGMTP